jgi:hypothetical protein
VVICFFETRAGAIPLSLALWHKLNPTSPTF